MAATSATTDKERIHFHTFDVTEQVFLQREHTVGIVNLMPIAPLHVLLLPRQRYHRLSEVPYPTLCELFAAVQETSNVVQRLTNATACTVAIQDGAEAGQSVPHLHVHVIPRRAGDFTPKDVIYEHLQSFGLGLHRQLEGKADEEEKSAPPRQDQGGLAPDGVEQERVPRQPQEMYQEAEWIAENWKDGLR